MSLYQQVLLPEPQKVKCVVKNKKSNSAPIEKCAVLPKAEKFFRGLNFGFLLFTDRLFY